jgi:hypothetical protein
MTKEAPDFSLLRDELQESAAAFSSALENLAVVINADISKVIRKSILDVEKNIVKRSPVDTGAYRASHGIANIEPDDEQGIVNADDGQHIPKPPLPPFDWKIGDGDIWLFNNQPYAEPLEVGHSGQAPQGVYRLAIPEFTQSFNQEVAKTQTLLPNEGEGE